MPVSASQFKTFFTEFADEDDGFVGLRLLEAGRSIDDSWGAEDGMLATMYLAAHYVMVSVQRRESQTGQVVSSERFGPMSVSYAQLKDSADVEFSDLTSTPYGSRYLELSRLNFPPVLII